MRTDAGSFPKRVIEIGPIDASQRRAAGIVGSAYLLAIMTAAFGEFYVRARLVVPNDTVQTAQNILANERLFRLGIASDLATYVIDVVLIAALYVVLRPVDQSLALLAALWRVVETAVLVVVTLADFDALRILSGADRLRAFAPDQLQTMAALTLSGHGTGFTVGIVFLGLGSTVFGYLWLRSRYVPRALAMLGVLASLLAAIVAFGLLIFPELISIVSLSYQIPLGVFELALGLWLLFRGLPQGTVASSDGSHN
jgi:hypothetical protein